MTEEARADWPKYLMLINDDRKWMPIRLAGITYDYGWADVRIGGFVREESDPDRERPITEEERRQIRQIADDYSASK